MKKLIILTLSIVIAAALFAVIPVSNAQAGFFGLSKAEKEEYAHDIFVDATKEVNRDIWKFQVKIVKVVEVEYDFYGKSTARNRETGQTYQAHVLMVKGYCYIDVSNRRGTFDRYFCVVDCDAGAYENEHGEKCFTIVAGSISILEKVAIQKPWEQDLRERFAGDGLTANSPVKFVEKRLK